MSSIEERVKKIVVDQLGVKEEDVTPNASFVDDLGADSLDTVELVMALEEEFETEIPDEEAEKITTVQAAIDYAKAKVVKTAQRRQVPEGQGSVGHVEVLRMGGVRTPIIGRPRPSPRHRRAAVDRTAATPSFVMSPFPWCFGVFVVHVLILRFPFRELNGIDVFYNTPGRHGRLLLSIH